MEYRRFVTSVKLVITLAASFFALNAHAIQLGDIRANSSIGEPLNATVGVWLTAKDKAEPISFRLTPDLAYLSNRRLSSMVEKLSAELATSPDGQPYIRIRSDISIDEPMLAFRLKVYVGRNAVMRNYSVMLNPAPRARPATAAPATPRARRTATPIEGANYTVAQGDTLWAIARRVGKATGGNPATLVNEIFETNPQAFVGGNQNRLMLGAELRLPTGEAIAEVPVAEPAAVDTAAPATPAKPSTVIAPTTAEVTPRPEAVADAAPPTVAVDAPTTLATTSAAPVAAVSSAPPRTSARPPVDWRQRDPKLAAELEALRLKYLALKQRYDTQTSSSAADSEPTIAASGEADLREQAQSPTVSPAAQEPIKQQQSEPPATASTEASRAAPSLEQKDTRMAAETSTLDTLFGAGPIVLVALLIGAFVIVAVLVVTTRKSVGALRHRRAELAHHAREADFKAEVARKAANRIEMEGEVQRMLHSRSDDMPADEPDVAPDAAAVVAASPDQSSDAVIDHNIAHGRYGEAESQLLEVIAATPRNFSAKLRLLEVYYITEQIGTFCSLAEDLHQNHRADMSDDEWSRVVRMGKIVAPDRMPFSGPRGIENPNEAS